MPIYTCEKCLAEFVRKSGYDAHIAKKKPCKPPKTAEKLIEEKAIEIAKTLRDDMIVLPENEDERKIVLQKFFEDLHNLLWSSAGLSPEKALEHMTFFFAYRLLENQAETLGLDKVCHWSYVASIKDEHELLEKVRKGYEEFNDNPITKHFFKQPEISKAMVVYNVVKLINKLPLKAIQESDTLGAIFEYMLGRGMSSMSDEGQYFTNRKICELAFELAYSIKKTIRRPDGTLNTFADWFCGTGGFPAEFVKGMAHKAAEAGEPIDWAVDSKSIYCQDMSVSSVSTTLLNMLILTGTLFSSANIRSGNSFTDQITIGAAAPFKDVDIDYCFMNPPYGGDKTKGKDYKFAYAKGKGASKVYHVNQEIQNIGIEDDDKVSAGVQLAMATLSKDGVCSIVLPQGFFFGASKKAVELRKKIAEEYKIHYVVDIASGAFVNTGTKTSMLVFQKGGLTESVKFIDMDEKVLVEATLEQLRGKNYSLNYKQYLAQEAVEVEGFEMVKLGDIVKPSSVKSHNTTDGNRTGKYPLVSSALNVEYYMDTYDSDTPSLIFNTINADGNCSVHYYEKFNVTSNTYVLSCDNKTTLQYLYYYLKMQPELLKSCFEGTTKKALSRPLLLSLEIPLPSLERQQQIVEAIDGWTVLAQQEEQALKTLEKQVMFQVKEMGRGKERVKLGDVCDVHYGSRITKKESLGDTYPVFGSGGDTFRSEKKNREGVTCKVGRFAISEHNCVQILHTDYWCLDSAFTVSAKEEKVTNCYLWYWLLNNSHLVYECSRGTAQQHIDMESFRNFEFPLTSLAEQQTLQPDFDEIRHKHAKIAYYKAKAADAIKRLIPGAE